MLVSVLLLAIFLAFVVLLYLKRISAMLALPLMALLFAVVAKIPREDILEKILEHGPLTFGPAIMAAIFGGMLALFIKNQGIAEAMVRYAAELGGERPVLLSFLLMMVTAVLFMLLGGLGTVIMVGSIVIPIMLSVGVPPLTAACLMLFGLAMGGMLNLGNWQLYVSMLALPQNVVQNFMIILFALFFVTGTLFCIFSLRRSQLHRFWPAPEQAAPPLTALHRLAMLAPFTPLACALLLDWPIVPSFIVGLLFTLLVSTQAGQAAVLSLLLLLVNLSVVAKFYPTMSSTHLEGTARGLAAMFDGILLLLPFLLWLVLALRFAHKRQSRWRTRVALLSPLLPLTLIHFVHMDMISAFILGMLLAIMLTVRRDTMQVFTKSVLEGFESAGPAVILIIGIGMLYETVIHEKIKFALAPLLQGLMPDSPILFVIIFGALAPLALYRGPLNIWGMGAGFATIMLANSNLHAEAIMAVLASLGAIQGLSDPTNTHNAWIASYAKVETLDIMKRTIVFVWPMSIVALMIAAAMYF